MLLPHLAAVVIDGIVRVAGAVEVWARPRAGGATCPECGKRSQRVHSRYERRLADAAIGGQPVRIRLRVRRFRCAETGCARATFAEQVDGLTTRYGRRSQLLDTMLATIGLALAGRAGARLADRLGLGTSRDTLLRLVRALPDRAVGVVPALGVDDFALRRGHVYGTVIIDIDTHRPIEVLADRTADTLADWLREHPGVEVVCRDRAGAYAEAVRSGAPGAIQVADRWHLWHNLAQAVEKTVARHRLELQGPPPVPSDAVTEVPPVPIARPSPPEKPLTVRTRERHAAVQEQLAAGASISAIGRALSLNRRTVRRFARTADVEQLLGKAGSRGSLLDPFKPYLHERFNAGHTDAAALTEQIKALGYRGSDKTVRRYLQPFRETRTAPPAVPIPPTLRQVTGWLTRHPDSLDEDERMQLTQILARSPELAATHRHVHDFAEIMTNRNGHRLPAWMREVDQHGEPALRSFVTGLRSDLDAVTNGLTLPYSSGPVEGAVNRIKMIKRQMFGRANFDLLRKRVVLLDT